MKTSALATALLAAAFAAVAFATPADAQKNRRKDQTASEQSNSGYMAGKVPPHLRQPTGVYGADGDVIGMDPDPHIRLQLMRDPKPWGDR